MKILLKKAISAHQKADITSAEPLYEQIIAINPYSHAALHNLGIIYIMTDRQEKGLILIQKALEIEKNNEIYWISYFDALILTDNFELINNIYIDIHKNKIDSKLLEIFDGKYTHYVNNKIRVLADLFTNTSFIKAEQLARNLIKFIPDNGHVYKIFGAILQKLGRTEESIQAKLQSVVFLPNDYEALTNLGYSLLEKGELYEAKIYLLRAIALKNDHVPALNNLGLALIKLNFFDEAEEHLQKALSVDPNFANSYENLGNIYLIRKMYEDAKKCYLSALALPHYKTYIFHNNLGVVEYETGCIDNAIKYYEYSIDLMPNNEQCLYNLASAYYASGNLECAITLFSKIIEINTTTTLIVDASIYLSIIFYLSSNYSNSHDMLLNLNENSIPVQAVLRPYYVFMQRLLVNKLSNKTENILDRKDILYIIGESHSLPLHDIEVNYNKNSYVCKSMWIVGCKQYHLGNRKKNHYKYRFEKIMSIIPRSSAVLLTIGEIDCRPNEGILKAHSKYQDKTLDQIIRETINSYIDYALNIASLYEHKLIVCGIPATNIDLELLKKMESNVSGEVYTALLTEYGSFIECFNQILEEKCLHNGIDFLDVFKVTNVGKGIADGSKHIDNFHLTPKAIIEAFDNHLKKG